MCRLQSDKRNDGNFEMMIPVSGPDDEQKNGIVEEADAEMHQDTNDVDRSHLEHLQRLQAEFDNYRKRVEKEKESLFSWAKGDLIHKLLSIVDDFDRMLNHHQEEQLEGANLIYRNMMKILFDEGLEEIDSVGQIFDPDIHEAVGVESVDQKRDGIVMEEWQRGYRFGSRLLRPSKVKVGKYSAKTGAE